MLSETTLGMAIVLLAACLQGSFMLPTKWMRNWQWENYWLIFSLTAYLVCPWALAWATIPNLAEVYQNAPLVPMLLVLLFGSAWGIGAVTFGLGIDAVGMALGFAVILGVATMSGTIIPLIGKPPSQFSLMQGWVMGASLLTMLVGVAWCSFAGRWKEQQDAAAVRGSYKRGILLCIASGLLSSCANLGYAWGEVIYARAAGPGVPVYFTPNALWPLLTPPLLVCNAGYAIYLLRKNHTADRFRTAGAGLNIGSAALMGLMWMSGMALYGIGAFRLGELGKSLGWAIFMSSMVLVANALGVLTGEWRGAPASAKWHLTGGIATLLAAIAGLGYANTF